MNEPHATDNNAQRSAQAIALERNLEGSSTTEADGLKSGYVRDTSATPRDFAFTGSHWRPPLFDPTLPRNRRLIAALSFIGIFCVALSAYLYFTTNAAQRSATQNLNSAVQNPNTIPSAELERGVMQGPTGAVAPLTERSGADVASRMGSTAAESGNPSSTSAQSCTEVVHALGLCPPQAAQRK